MRLHLYLARRFGMVFGITFVVLFLFIALIDLVEQLRKLGDSASFAQVMQVTLLNTPQAMYQILPLVMILSAVALFIALSRSSELVALRSAGRSGTIAVLAPALVAAVIGVLAVAILNPVVAATSKRYTALVEMYRSGGSSTVSIGSEGLWLRQGDARGQTVIRAARANPEATVLYDVSFVAYAAEGSPVRRIEAAEATLAPGYWQLRTAKAWPLAEGLNPEASAATHDTLRLPSSLSQERIRDSFATPSAVPIYDLPDYVAQLEEAGFSARRHLVWFHMELSKPLFLVAMVLVGAGFTMGHARMGGTGRAILAAILLGFGLYYVRNFAQILGENGQLSAPLAAWLPPMASVLLAFGLILQREEG